MANLNISNRYNLKFAVNKDEYWDFYISKDAYTCHGGFPTSCDISERCLISYIDMCDPQCVGDDMWIYGKPGYSWENALSVGYTLYNIPYVGVDNGLFTYRKDRITNKEFTEFFSKHKYVMPENDYRLKLHAVSGNNLVYEYPLEQDLCYSKLNGGFYQGFFKTECDKYQVLPAQFEDGDVLHFEFTLKRCDLEPQSSKTLNDKYPTNKGIFFFIGTRAENKWIYQYDKEDVDGLEDCLELGVDDFVENGEIDKEDYIIGNFYDLDVEFEEDPPIDIDNYLNFNYYDDGLYAVDECDWKDMTDYLELEYVEKAKLIDENAEHTTMDDWCCNEEESNESNKCVLSPFFTPCRATARYRRENPSEGLKTSEKCLGCCMFGDGYIDGLEDVPNEEYDYVEPELDITDFEYYTDNGFNFAQANQYYFYTDNKFMMFDRTCDGMTVKDWVEGTQYMYHGIRSQFKGNLFMLMDRTCSGYNVNTIDELREKDDNYYNPYNDLYNNALAFRITDKGELGYRLLTIDCEKEGRDKTLMMEGYSFEGVVPYCEWVTINARITFLGGDKMKLMFYVNGKLVYVTKELPRIDLRALNDLYEKQEGVPYNISIGGGTQGLADTVQYNYMLEPTRVYPMERYFAGSFIGYFRSFRMYDCLMEKMVIECNHEAEARNEKK